MRLDLVLVVLIIVIGAYNIISEKNSIEYAKSGLEQCQYRGNYPIWVKSCTEYLKIKEETKK
jgi:hypothetical protein